MVAVDALGTSEYEVDGWGTVFSFARVYADDLSPVAAYKRGRETISKVDDASLIRVRAPDAGQQMLCVLSGTCAGAKRAHRRIAWGGVEYHPTPDEIGAIASRFREVADFGALNSSASWSAAGGLGLGREGSRGLIRRPQG